MYKTASKTVDLESAPVLFDGAQTVKVLKVALDPLSNYSRNSGFTDGSVTANWESMKLTQDRGKEFNLDVMDNEETLDVMAGNLLGTFIRQKSFLKSTLTVSPLWHRKRAFPKLPLAL